MTKASSSESARLKQLRQSLNLSQRELAHEFKVTGGAIAHWESGKRPIPGTILRLMEIYEESLNAELESTERDQQIRKLGTSWSTRIFSALNAKHSHEPLRQVLTSYLKRDLSRDEVKRKIQIAILEKFVDSAGRAKGLWMKTAQLLSYMNPNFPVEIRDILVNLETATPAMPPSIAARVVYDELGESPRRLFKSWDPHPFAVGSIGQVHRAVLHSGETVAVKIQYPEVSESIRSDLKLITFLNELAMLVNASNREILREVHDTILAECDYEAEAAHQIEFGRIFAGHPEIVIPRVYPKMSGKRVLTTEYIEGRRMADFNASASEEEKNNAGMTIWKFFAISLFRKAILHADHHFGNFLFLDGGRVAFLDFGRVVRLKPESMQNQRNMFLALIQRDKEAARKVARGYDFIRDWEALDFDEFWALLLSQQTHLTLDRPFRFSREYLVQFQNSQRGYPDKDNMRMTSEMLWYACSCLGCWNVLAEMGAAAPWGALALELIQEEPA